MTIITGSSFPYIAIAFSDKPVYIASAPKAGTAAFHYVPQSAAQYVVHNLDNDGNLDLRQEVDFKAVIAHHLRKNNSSHIQKSCLQAQL
jgi:hypothetical protein